MLRLRSRLYLEPGEIELLAEAAGREGRRLHRAGGSSLPGAAILERVGSELAELLADPHPPLYVIGRATKRQSRLVARRMADGVRERPAVCARDGARGRRIAIARAGRMWPEPGYGGRDGARCYDDGQEQASITPLIGPSSKRIPISMCLSREEGVDPAVCSGKPCIRGTRIMVRNILGMIAGGYTVERVLAEYPGLMREDVAAALEYASLVVDEEKVISRD